MYRRKTGLLLRILRVYISWLVIREAKINIKIPGFEIIFIGFLGSEVLNAVSVPLLETDNAERVGIVVRNLQGQSVHQQIWRKEAGKQFISISLGKLSYEKDIKP
jgi:hypothetical protein